jgi:hypothetical protein
MLFFYMHNLTYLVEERILTQHALWIPGLLFWRPLHFFSPLSVYTVNKRPKTAGLLRTEIRKRFSLFSLAETYL